MPAITEPQELSEPWPPDPKDDAVIRDLNQWQPKEIETIRFPKWLPGQLELWEELNDSADFATVKEIESLAGAPNICSPPYHLLDEPSDFPELKSFAETKPPQEPAYVRMTYPAGKLTLPEWQGPWRFLNMFVRMAHADLIARYTSLEKERNNREATAVNLNRARRIAWQAAVERHRLSAARQAQALNTAQKDYMEAKENYVKARNAELEPLRKVRVQLANPTPEAITQHFDLALRRLALPAFVSREWMLRFEPETKTLLLEHRFPETARLVITKGTWDKKPVAKTLTKRLLRMIQPALCLKFSRAIADADNFNFIDAIIVNGWVDYYERATGHPKRAYCASLVVKKTEILKVNLDTADPVVAFSALRGASAGDAYETAPVLPSLRLQTDDIRFIEPRATLEKMARGENLAAMDWEDFEHLVRELFEREFAANGGQVKITRASRDQGVDAIIFDPDPLRGGKIVIQAKRYTMPVDVSAVRDLYGTVLNEGANTGILVTTSHYGPEAYEFAQNKPLKLINGSQLLGLLEKSGYRFRIDLAEARALITKQQM
ncbi:hypothetical protein SCL_2672 [Sulfuricaulis limicola]|uniref:Restriction endonuclease type IV Mrr domain-containing protein n=1 Tax=Sulfuricaulis limicola TaxID=1620215 RepID=A0A1B4XJG9_9GAMM|nr:hypothetical protein SCL_2672 [Sulfuricaulis limicola]